jgi:hypothetical protein
VLAVAAGTLYFFSKQHIIAPFDFAFQPLYYILLLNATTFFCAEKKCKLRLSVGQSGLLLNLLGF